MRWLFVLVTMLLAFPAALPHALSQVCGQWQTGIGPDGAGGGIAGTDGSIYSLVSWDPDGQGPASELAVISGRFQVVGTVVTNTPNQFGDVGSLATWDGERWAAFPGPLPADVPRYPLTLLGTDGPRLIGVVRLYASSRIVVFENGVWTQIGEEFTGDQYTINAMVAIDGELFVGGRFTHVGTTVASLVARWDGQAWQSMGEGLSGGRVNALSVYLGEVVAGGTFTTSGQSATTYAAKWNRTEWEQMGTGATAPVNLLTSVGEVLFASRATNGGANLGVMIWDGEAWSTPSAAFSSTRAFQPIASMTIHDGVLWAAGSFVAGGMQLGQYRAARWVNNGWELTGSARPIVPSANSLLLAFRDNEPLVAATSVYVGFTQPVVPVRHFVNNDWHPAGDGFDGPVNHLVDLGEGRVMAVGPFTGVGGRLVNGIARWNGAAWEAMDAGMPQQPGTGSEPHIRGATLFNGNPIVIGTFASVGGNSAVRSVARWDGQTWGPLGVPGAFGNQLATGIGIYQGDLFVSRQSGSHNAYTHRIRRFDGETWTDVPGELATPYVTKPLRMLQFGDDLIAAGDITSAGGVPVRGVARWNGNSWSAMGEVFDPNYGHAELAVHNGELFVAAQGLIRRWNGEAWELLQLAGLTGNYIGPIVSHDNHLWITSQMLGLARWDGPRWARAGGTRIYPWAKSMIAVGDDLLVAGEFLRQSDGRVVSILARWTPEPDEPLIEPIETSYHARTGSYVNLAFTTGGTGPHTVERIERNGIDVPFDYPNRVDAYPYATNLLHVQVPHLTLEDAGDYIVTISNGCGEVSSTPVTLTIQCAADFDSDGQISVADVFAFLAAWFAREDSSNYDGNHLIDISDLFGWLSSWLGRCGS